MKNIYKQPKDIETCVEYSELWNEFQFRPPTYIVLNNEDKKKSRKDHENEYDLVKYFEHDPYIVTNLETGKQEMSTKSCISIITLIWDVKENRFKFKCIGDRFRKYYCPRLAEYIYQFMKEVAKEKYGVKLNSEDCIDMLLEMHEFRTKHKKKKS